jgi:hypothetical protein
MIFLSRLASCLISNSSYFDLQAMVSLTIQNQVCQLPEKETNETKKALCNQETDKVYMRVYVR